MIKRTVGFIIAITFVALTNTQNTCCCRKKYASEIKYPFLRFFIEKKQNIGLIDRTDLIEATGLIEAIRLIEAIGLIETIGLIEATTIKLENDQHDFTCDQNSSSDI